MSDIKKRLEGLSDARRELLVKQLIAGKGEAIYEPLAVVGMACRFPKAENSEAYWELLDRGGDAITEVPPDRWNVDHWYDPDPQAMGKMVTRWGGFLENVDQFDAGFFGISPREAEHMDPQQRILLEVAWDTIENAGITQQNLEGSKTGVFIGVSNADYFVHSPPSLESIDPYVGTGSAFSIVANRLSYLFDLRGPSIAIDTACSSSLVALHLACKSLQDGDSDMVLAGGINLVLSPIWTLTFSKFGFLSKDGRCKTFDARADGYVRGEGCGMVVLKRLREAQEQGDNIMAVIRGSAVNQDGRTAGLTAPNVLAQQKVIQTALQRAGITPDEIDYIETHGTGTPLGDPIEIGALTEVFGNTQSNHPIAIGSVKTNIGHLEAAAGIAQLAKVLLSFQHQTIPPHANFKRLNPNISLEQTPFVIPTKSLSWPRTERRRYAGISSFGFGGTNAHLVLEEAPPAVAVEEEADKESELHLLALSAHSAEALQALSRDYQSYLTNLLDSVSATTLCYNAALRRSHHRYRLALVGQTREELTDLLQQRSESAVPGPVASEESRLVFVFSGQGTQWRQMGQLLQHEAVYQERLRHCDELLKAYAPWSLLEQLTAPDEQSRVDETELAQVAIFAVQIALTALWRSWGIEPEAVVGHSVGEVAAAHIAGVLSLEDALRVVYERGRLMQQTSGQGKMAVVGLTLEQTQGWIKDYGERLTIAAHNSPQATVISGEVEAVDELVQQLTEREVFVQVLDVNCAFHSAQMDPCREALEQQLKGLQTQAAQKRIISTVIGEEAEGSELDAAYWGRNVRESVRFYPVIDYCIEQGYRHFVEVGPHAALGGSIRESLDARGIVGEVVGSARRGDVSRRSMLKALGVLYEAGHQVRWEGVYPDRQPHLVLPSYPWQRQRYWRETTAVSWGQSLLPAETQTSHPLLGRSCSIADAPQGTYYWDTTLNLESIPYLRQHIIQGASVLPITVYLELALAAAKAVFTQGEDFELCDIHFEKILFLPLDGTLSLQTTVNRQGNSQGQFRIYSRSTDTKGANTPWTLHAQGGIRQASYSISMSTAVQQVRKPMTYSYMFFAASEDSLQGDMYRLVMEAGRFADQHGFSAVWVPERHFTKFGAPYPNPSVLHAALARETRNIRLRAGSVVVPLHNPIRIAEEWSMVDNLSEGRVELSFASGWHPTDFTFAPEKYRDRHTELFRDIETIRRLWRGEYLEVNNGVGEKVKIRSYPTPVQREVPIWITAAGNPQTFARAGEMGANLLTHLLDQDVESVGSKIAIYREALAKHGFDPEAGRVALMLHTFVGEDIDVVREQVRKPYCEYLKSIAPLLQGLAVSRGKEFDFKILSEAEQDEFANFLFERLFSTRSLLGTPESCAELIEQLRSIGVDEIACLLDIGPRSDLILQNLPHLYRLKEASNSQAVRGGSFLPQNESLQNILKRCANEVSADVYYQGLRAHGVQDGPAFLAVEQLWCGENEVVGKVRVPDTDAYQVHPAFLAACFQTLFGAISEEQANTQDLLPIPTGLEVFRVYRQLPDCDWLWSHAQLKPSKLQGQSFEGEIRILDQEGELIAAAVGLKFMQKSALQPVRNVEMLNRLLYDFKWDKKPIDNALFEDDEVGTWIVFADASGIGEQLGKLLEAAGNTCFLIYQGENSYGERRYYIPANARQPMDKALKDIEQRAELPIRGLVYLWSCDGDDSHHPPSVDELEAAQGLGVGSALDLINILINAGIHTRMWFATRGVQVIGGRAGPLSVAQASLWGFARVISSELRELWGGVIDLDPQDIAAVSATQLLDTIANRDGENQIAFDSGERYVARLTRRPLPELGRNKLHFQEDATYMITGGLGDLGLAIARWMVSKGARHVLLLGRSEIPPRGEWQSIDENSPLANQIAALVELEIMGATVHTLAVDIADEKQMSSGLKQFRHNGGPEIRGVIHCAATYDGAMLIKMDHETLRSVMHPKVGGAWVLHRLFEDSELDLFVLFSAIPSLIGWIGQGAANYAAANSFLDTLAYYRRARNLPAISITWGPWDQIGVAARTDGGLEKLSLLGVGAIQPEQALQLLEQLIIENPTHIAAVNIDWQKFFQKSVDAVNDLSLSELISEEEASGAGETWDLTRDKLLAIPAPDRQPTLQLYFQEKLARILRMPVTHLDAYQPLTELGVDSLMAIEFRTGIQFNLGVSVPLVNLLQGPSLTEIATLVVDLIEHPQQAKTLEFHHSAVQRADDPAQSTSYDTIEVQTEGTLNFYSDQDVDTLLESMLDEDQEDSTVE